MIIVNVSKLMDAVQEAGTTENNGYEQGRMYLLENFMAPLFTNGAVALSDLDFDAFDLEDIYPVEVAFGWDRYGEVDLKRNVQESYKACRLKQGLKVVKPIAAASNFI